MNADNDNIRFFRGSGRSSDRLGQRRRDHVKVDQLASILHIQGFGDKIGMAWDGVVNWTKESA